MSGNHNCNPIVLGEHVLIFHCIQEFHSVFNRQETTLRALVQNFNEDFYIHGQDTSLAV